MSDKVKQGKIKICPNCGATLKAFASKCEECGHELTLLESNATVKELQKQLDEVDKDPSLKKTILQSDDPKEKKKEEIIVNFPIPNTKDDFIEFVTLCIAQVANEGDLSEAWIAKSKQLISKSKLLFKNDPQINSTINELEKSIQKQKKSNKKSAVLGLSIIIIILVVLVGLLILLDSNEEKEIDGYTNQQIELINQLPMPNAENYMECFQKFNQIQWTKNKQNRWESGYKAFLNAQKAYGQLLVIGFKEAGVSNEDIPSILTSGYTNTKDEDEDIDPTEYIENQLKLVTQLPTPKKRNYKECYQKFENIKWDKPKTGIWEEAYNDFESARKSYAQLLVIAFKEAGVEEGDIPSDLKDYREPNENEDYTTDSEE